MAQVLAAFSIERTMCGLTFYMWEGRNFVRKKSSLGGKRVKTSPEFANTRVHAGILKQASSIASVIYQALPGYWRQFWVFRAFTGEAMQLLKAGKTREQAIGELWRVYVAEHEAKGAGYKAQEPRVKKEKKREYRKRDMQYWEAKTLKAQRRRRQREKLQYNAQLMAKASKLGSVLYRSLPQKERKYPLYKTFTGMAMRLLREGVAEPEVQLLLERFGRPEAGKSDTRKYEVRSRKEPEMQKKQATFTPVSAMDSIVCIPITHTAYTNQRTVKRRRCRVTHSYSSRE